MAVVIYLFCAILLIILLCYTIRRILIVRSFLNLASINEASLHHRLKCIHNSKATYGAVKRHVKIHGNCDLPTFKCWQRSVAGSSLHELSELANWCQ